MRPVWTGGISFGLIFIPINLYTATESVTIDLDLLSKKGLNPIRYARMDKVTGKEVAWKDVVKGYEYKKGDYVVLEDDDVDKIALHRSDTIEISAFVDRDEIDIGYFEKPYFIEPDKGASKTYAILRDALKKSNRVGIAEFIFKNREHLCAISVENDMLQLNQMRYSEEIRETDGLKIPGKIAVTEKELKMAVQLVDAMSEKFDPTDYKDDYFKALKKVIENKKNKRGETTKVKQVAAPDKTDISDIMKQLEKSLAEYSVSK